MELYAIDICAFVGFIGFVVVFSLIASRKEESSEDYFLAGRGLTWWLIGISLIASNISTEHFVGMAGRGYELGLAIASYEWMAAVAMVLVALFFLPKFLRSGIYTIPEYLEYRYSSTARGLMAFFMMLAYIFVAIASVLYAGAIGLDSIFGETIKDALARSGFLDRVDLPGLLGEHWIRVLAVWVIGIVAGIYTVYGGLKAVVWADLFNGVGLILGGALVTFLGFLAIGAEGIGGANPVDEAVAATATDPAPGDRATAADEAAGDDEAGPDSISWPRKLVRGVRIFFTSPDTSEKLTTVKPWNHGEMPWVAVFIGGLWIPQIFYWGLNQFITQRTLGAKSVSEGQKGVLFAACLKLIIPFIIIFPGIMAAHLYADQVAEADAAYPIIIKNILPAGLRGLMLAALFGAIMSSLDSMLNSASTIFTMDLYKQYFKKDASSRSLVTIGRAMTALFVIIGCLWAPQVSQLGGGSVFKYIQSVWGFLSPGIVVAFMFGIFVKRTPANAAVGAMLLGIPIYGWCLWAMPDVAFLHHMAITFVALSVYMTLLTVIMPLGDADDRSEEVPTHRGPLVSLIIPVATAVVGGAMFAYPMYSVSELVYDATAETEVAAAAEEGAGVAADADAPAESVGASEASEPGWNAFPCVASTVAVLIYMAAVTFLLSLPVPVLKRAPTKPEAPEKPLPAKTSWRPLAVGAAAVAGAAVFGLHMYLLGTWLWPGLSHRVCLVIAEVTVGLFLAAVILLHRMPAAAETEMPVTSKIDLTPSPAVEVWGFAIIFATVVLYTLFF